MLFLILLSYCPVSIIINFKFHTAFNSKIFLNGDWAFFFYRDRCCLMSTCEFESLNGNNWGESSKTSYSEYCSQFMSVSQNVLDLFLIGWWVFVQIKQQENSDIHSTLLSLASMLSRPFHLLVKTINSKLNGCGLGLKLLFFQIKQVFTTQTWIFMLNFRDE